MLGQIFLITCVVAAAGVVGILFVLFGPIPVKRSVTVVPRLAIGTPAATLSPPPSLAAQLARANDEFFTPPQPIQSPIFEGQIAHAAPPPAVEGRTAHAPPPRRQSDPEGRTSHASPPPVPAKKPTSAKVQPLPKKRSAKGTEAPSPFAPVVRSGSRQAREEELATSPVELFSMTEVSADLFPMDEMTAVDDPVTVPRGRSMRHR